MSTDQGWTRVHHKSRHSSKPSPKPPLPDTFTPRTTGILRSPQALRADYDTIHTQWLTSSTRTHLIHLLDTHARHIPIRTAICLGIGTFDPDDGGWDAKRAAYIQLCAFSTITSQLEKYTHQPIQSIFQDPIFTSSDTSFLTSLSSSCQILSSPAAFSLIDNTTLLFAIHLYRPIYSAALSSPSNLPAIFIGTGWDIWDTVTMEGGTTDLENMRKMDETYTRCAFPQDVASTAFSSTSIYFAPREATTAVRPALSEGDKQVVVGDDAATKPSTKEDVAHDSAAEEGDTTDDDTDSKKCSAKRSEQQSEKSESEAPEKSAKSEESEKSERSETP